MTKNLKHLFDPRSVALIGATDRPRSVGLGIVNNLLIGSKQRKIYFVNPYQKKVKGMPTYSSVLDIPEKVDLVVIAVPGESVLEAARQCVQKKVGAVIIISSGFAETGKEGKERQKKLLEIFQSTQIPLLGPNCLGVIRPKSHLNASFAPVMPKAGEIAFISQSGAILNSVIDYSTKYDYGFSYLISSGNEADLSITDFIRYLGDCEDVKVIAIYVEGISRGREFMDIAKKVGNHKPIIALKAGQTERGRKIAFLHTASLAGSTQIYQAAFKQSGVKSVSTLEEMLDVVRVLAWKPRIANGIGIISNAGGMMVLATDYSERAGIKIPLLSLSTKRKLKKTKVFSSSVLFNNPFDVLGDASPERYKAALESLLSQKNINGLIVMQTMQINTEAYQNAKVIIEAQRKWPQKPIISTCLPGEISASGLALLQKNHIPNYPDPDRAIKAMKALLIN